MAASTMNTDSVYITQLKDLLVRLDGEGFQAQINYVSARAGAQEEYKSQIISITSAWASMAGIYQGLTGNNDFMYKPGSKSPAFSISRWIDPTIPGFENAQEIYDNGIVTGIELSEMIKESADIATGDNVSNDVNEAGEIVYGFSKRVTFGGRKKPMMSGGASKSARVAMTLAIISGLSLGVIQSPLPTATITAYSQAKNYLLQLAYGMRVIKTGCMSGSAHFWNGLMMSIVPNGALDSCVQIARDNKAALIQLRTAVIGGFNTLLAALSSSGLVLGRGTFTSMFTFIEMNIADPLCDLITDIVSRASGMATSMATDMAEMGDRTCRKMTRDIKESIESLIKYARDNRPIQENGQLAEIANAFEDTVQEVVNDEPFTQRRRTDAAVGTSASAADIVTMDEYLATIGADEKAMEIIVKLQQKAKKIRSGGRRRRTKKYKKTSKSRPKKHYRKTRQNKRKVSKRKLHTK